MSLTIRLAETARQPVIRFPPRQQTSKQQYLRDVMKRARAAIRSHRKFNKRQRRAAQSILSFAEKLHRFTFNTLERQFDRTTQDLNPTLQEIMKFPTDLALYNIKPHQYIDTVEKLSDALRVLQNESRLTIQKINKDLAYHRKIDGFLRSHVSAAKKKAKA